MNHQKTEEVDNFCPHLRHAHFLKPSLASTSPPECLVEKIVCSPKYTHGSECQIFGWNLANGDSKRVQHERRAFQSLQMTEKAGCSSWKLFPLFEGKKATSRTRISYKQKLDEVVIVGPSGPIGCGHIN
jgi:hypothetical protein